MARARALSAYPPAFWEILERVVVEGQVISRTVDDKRAAMRLQGKFYAFRQAIKREVDQAILHPDRFTAGQVESLNNLLAWAQTAVCWFDRTVPDGQALTVSFMHRDNTPEARMLQDMLDANPREAGGAAPNKVQASLTRLLGKLEGDEK